MWKIWLVLSGLFLVVEIITVGFFAFWFSAGAFITMLVSLFTDNVAIQSAVFIISSTILLFATKPLVNKILPKEPVVKTNSSSFEGKTGKVISNIVPDDGLGQVKVDGEVWSAKSSDNTYIPKDTEIIVEKIEGVKAIVKPLK